MRLLVPQKLMHNAGPMLVNQLGEFLDCTEEEMQILLDGPINPIYFETLDNISRVTHDRRLLVFSSKGIQITINDKEFDKYYHVYMD